MAIEGHLVFAVDIVDVAALMVKIAGDAQGQLVLDDRDVDIAIDLAAHRRAVGRRDRAVDPPAPPGQVGLAGDVADRAAHRTGTEQRALGPGQNLDAVEIDRIDIEVAPRHRTGRIVEIERDVGLNAHGAHELRAGRIGRKAANVDRGHTRSARGRPHVRHLRDEVFKVRDMQVAQRLAAQRPDRQRDLVGRFRTAGGCHDDIGQAAIVGGRRGHGRGRCRRYGRGCGLLRPGRRAQRKSQHPDGGRHFQIGPHF
jgi:hypothetical protein